MKEDEDLKKREEERRRDHCRGYDGRNGKNQAIEMTKDNEASVLQIYSHRDSCQPKGAEERDFNILESEKFGLHTHGAE